MVYLEKYPGIFCLQKVSIDLRVTVAFGKKKKTPKKNPSMFSPIIQSPNGLKNTKKKIGRVCTYSCWVFPNWVIKLKPEDCIKKSPWKDHHQCFGSALTVCAGLTEREEREETEDSVKGRSGKKTQEKELPLLSKVHRAGAVSERLKDHVLRWELRQMMFAEFRAPVPAAALPRWPGPYLFQSRKENKNMNPKGRRLIPTSHPLTGFPAPVGELLF